MLACPPQVLFLITTGRAGSMFLQQLFDHHPQVIAYPAQTGIYQQYLPAQLGSFEDAWKALTEAGFLHRHLNAHPDLSIGDRLDAPASERFTVDAERLKELLADELQGHDVIQRRDLVVALARAFTRLTGRAPDGARVLLEHVHVPAVLGEALADFPTAKVINVVREPVSGLFSMARHYRKEFGVVDPRSFNAFVENFVVEGWPLVAGRAERVAPEDYRVIRIEDLNARGQALMPELAQWLGLDDHPSLYEPTVGGRSYAPAWGAKPGGTAFRGNPAGAPNSQTWGWIDTARAEWLFGEHAERIGYTRDETLKPWQRALAPLTLVLPMRDAFSFDLGSHVKCTRYQLTFVPVVPLLLARLRAQAPWLEPLMEKVGLLDEGAAPRRALEEAVVLGASATKIAFDQWYFQGKTLLALARFKHRTRKGPAPEIPLKPRRRGLLSALRRR